MNQLAECWCPVTIVGCVNACGRGSNWHFSATKLLWKVETGGRQQEAAGGGPHSRAVSHPALFEHTGRTVCVCVWVICLRDSFLTDRSVHSHMCFYFLTRQQCVRNSSYTSGAAPRLLKGHTFSFTVRSKLWHHWVWRKHLQETKSRYALEVDSTWLLLLLESRGVITESS